MGIVCRLERGDVTRGVSLVASDDVGEDDSGVRLTKTALFVLQGAALGALLRASGEEDLDLCVGEDDRSDVAALHDDVVACGDGALLVGKRLAHGGDGTHGADGLVNARGADLEGDIRTGDCNAAGQGITCLMGKDDGLACSKLGHSVGIVKGHAALEREPGDAAIHRARVEVMEVEQLCDLLRNSGLAGPGRSVDSDNHRVFSSCSFKIAAPHDNRGCR